MATSISLFEVTWHQNLARIEYMHDSFDKIHLRLFYLTAF